MRNYNGISVKRPELGPEKPPSTENEWTLRKFQGASFAYNRVSRFVCFYVFFVNLFSKWLKMIYNFYITTHTPHTLKAHRKLYFSKTARTRSRKAVRSWKLTNPVQSSSAHLLHIIAFPDLYDLWCKIFFISKCWKLWF